jgi:HAE1 family hydrophobic/amphiphilic exporter-1
MRDKGGVDSGGLYRLAVDRPVTVLMIILGVVVFGLVSLTRIPLSLMPELNYPTITVRTTYEGAAPEEVENNISIPLEEALGVVTHLKRIQSVSKTDESDVLLEFDWNTDMNLATQEVSEKLERVFLPPEAKKPLILRYDPTQDPVMRLSLFGPMNLIDLRTYADQDFKRELEKIPGVAAVKVRGGLEEEVRVFLDENKLSLARLNIETLNRALAAQNINLAGGKLKEGSTEYIVRTVNEFQNLQEISDAVVGDKDGVPIRVRDIGRVERSFKDRDMVTRVNDRESVELEIFKESDANIVTLSRTLKQRLFGAAMRPGVEPKAEEKQGEAGFRRGTQPPLERTLPEGIKLKIVSDQANFITLAISNLKSAAVWGGLLAILVLFFFLKRFPPTFIVGLSIPFSVIATFAAMYLSGVTLNIMSLGGLALGVGMLVDNAIVVLESIARCREEGDEPRQAALRGVKEVGTAVAASTLTTVAVFFPIVFVEGIAGQVFKDLSLTVVYSLMASLAMSLFFIPMLSARQWASPEARTGEPLGRLIFVPRHWGEAMARIKNADGLLAKIIQTLDVPFFLAMGEPLWPSGRAVGRPPEESEATIRILAKRVTRMLFSPAWAFFRLVAGLMAMAAGSLGYLLRLVVAAIELLALWGGGLSLWLVSKALAKPLSWFDGVFERLVAFYRTAVAMAMARPFRIVIATGFAFLLLFLGINFLDTELIPQLHNRTLEVEANLPVGTPLEVTDQTVRAVADKILKLPEVEEVAVQSGVAKDDLTTTEGGEFSARMTVTLTNKGSMRRVEDRAVAEIRDLLSQVPDLRSKVRFPSLFSTKTPVEVEVYANDLERLKAMNRQAFTALAGIRGLTDLQTSLARGNPEIQIAYDRQRLSQYGLDIASVASLVRTKVLGQVQTKFDKGREKVDIRIQVRPEDRSTLVHLGDLVVNPGGDPAVPLSSVAELRTGIGPSEIRRVNQQRVAVLSANLKGAGLRRVSRDIDTQMAALPWGAEEGFRIAGQKDEMDQSSRSLVLALVLSIFLVYLVMASQFESLLHPFLIMFTIPLAFVGVVLVLLLFGIPISILVFIGMIMLAGIVVNNAIVLVDYINQLRERGMALEASIEQAGVVRMRPILMTTLTTLFGLMPLAFGFGAGSELQSPMAITVMAGLAVSTLLTLLVIPTLYVIVERKRASARNRHEKKEGQP